MGPQQYVFAGNLRIARESIAGGTLYYHKDHLGSSTAMTDSSGIGAYGTSNYMPFGSMRSTTGSSGSSYKFTDQELDSESGLYNYNARLYDPEIGRFISADPIVPDPFNPQSLNRYSYVLNNPLIYTDPSGYLIPGEEYPGYTETDDGWILDGGIVTARASGAPGPGPAPGPDENDIRRAQESFAYGASLAERLNTPTGSRSFPSFKKLWKHYSLDRVLGYKNECVLRVARSMKKSGDRLDSYTGRLLKGWPRDANEMARWFNETYFKADRELMKSFLSKYGNATGMFYQPDPGGIPHIDLWNRGTAGTGLDPNLPEVWFWAIE